MRCNHFAILIALSMSLVGSGLHADVTSILDAKLAADTTPVTLTAAIVTAVSADSFYIEADDRSSGLCVRKTGHGLGAEIRADISGAMQTDGDGERYIAATTTVANGSSSVRPIALSNSSLGGSDLPSVIPGGGQKGIPGGVGLNNIGMLVRIRGSVTGAGSGFFYIDDGAGLADSSGYRGVKVIGSMPLCPGMDPIGWYVEVTGISSISRTPSNTCRCALAIGTSLLNQIEKPSGLVYADLRMAAGATAGWGDAVAVQYSLWLTDCEIADSSIGRDPLEFTLGSGSAIAGFEQGIVGMQVGGKRFLIIPPELAYGEDGMPPNIPPNAFLLFEVELVSVN